MAPSPFVLVRGCCVCARGGGRAGLAAPTGTCCGCRVKGGCGRWVASWSLCTGLPVRFPIVSAVFGCSWGNPRLSHRVTQC